MKKIIEVKNLKKSYKELTALDGISFDVFSGEIIGLLGPNGSGKSTTINCMLSLLNFDDGTIKIFGQEMTPDANSIKEKIGVVFQDVAIFDELTVYENIDYFCGLYIKDKIKRKQYVNEVIELVQLSEFVAFRPKKLSGGLLRRLNIACGIAHKPKLIFLDEPTVAVDPQSRNNILEGIKKLNSDGATIVYTTHYMEEVEQICNRIIILDKGNIIATGNSQELKDMIKLAEKVSIESNSITEKNISEIKNMNEVEDVIYDGKILLITYNKGRYNLSNLVEFLEKNKVSYSKIFSEQPSLNDVFLSLTGKELRDL